MVANRNTFIKRILGFSLASWVNCILSIISTPITTALFAPTELGKINMFISYANILIPFIYFGFDQAYVRFYNEPPKDNDKNSLFRISFSITSILAVFVSVVVLCFWRYFSNAIAGEYSFIIAVFLAVYLFATLCFRMSNLKSRMDNAVKRFVLQSITSTFIVKIGFVAVVLVKPDATYAIGLRSVLLFIAGMSFIIQALRATRSQIVSYNKETVSELSKFAVPIFPTIFLVMLNLSLSQIMLRRYVDFATVGIFSNAVTIAGIITIIQSGLNTFWTPFVYEYYKERKKIQKMHHAITFLMVAFAFIIILGQDLIYYVLVDSDYWESKTVLALLLISPVCDVVSETLGLGIELSKKTYLKLPVYLVNIAVNLGSCLLLIPKYGIIGAAGANALASISMLLVKTVIGERFYRCSDNYSRLIISVILLIGAGVLGFAMREWINVYSLLSLLFVTLLYWKEARMITTGGLDFVNIKLKKKS